MQRRGKSIRKFCLIPVSDHGDVAALEGCMQRSARIAYAHQSFLNLLAADAKAKVHVSLADSLAGVAESHAKAKNHKEVDEKADEGEAAGAKDEFEMFWRA